MNNKPRTLRFKSREEWLRQRTEGIGASEIASIVGLNPWETPYQLWRRKTGLDEGKAENFAMRAGHYLEDAVSRFWQDETGLRVIKSSAADFIITNKDVAPHLQVSPDRLFWLSEEKKSGKGILECKTTQKQIDPDDLPRHWFCQVQANLGVAGFTQGSLAWLTAGREFGYKHINLVPNFFQWLTDECERFWHDHIETRQEPPLTAVQDILAKYALHTEGKIVETTADIYEVYKALKDVKADIKKLEAQQAAYEEKIKTAFQDAEALTYGGQTLATWKAPKPANKFDSKALLEADPNTYALYLRPQQGARRFVLK